jgi:hypothetical protein
LVEFILPTNGITFASAVLCSMVVFTSRFVQLLIQQKQVRKIILVIILFLICLEVAWEMHWFFPKMIFVLPFALLTLFITYKIDQIENP